MIPICTVTSTSLKDRFAVLNHLIVKKPIKIPNNNEPIAAAKKKNMIPETV